MSILNKSLTLTAILILLHFLMRRLQSFKSPSKLGEKLKFSTKPLKNGSSSSGTLKFIPNVGAPESNELNHNSKFLEQTNINLNDVEFKSQVENVKEPKVEMKLLNSSLSMESEPNLSKLLEVDNITIKSVKLPNPEEPVVQICSSNKNYESNSPEFENFLSTKNWSIIQMPKYIPSTQDVSNHSTEIQLPSVIQDIPSGSIGKLLIRRSGKMNLVLNKYSDSRSISLNLEKIVTSNSEQLIMALVKINELINLGSCDLSLVATPNF